MGTQLSREIMWQAKQMYDELDERGRRRHSMMAVAAFFGISETSVLRAVKNTGRFANINAAPLPDTRTERQWKEDAAASQKRFEALLAEEAATPKRITGMEAFETSVKKEEAEARAKERVIPPSPLDGGDAPSETEGAGLTKLVQVMKAGDALLEELQETLKEPREE